MKHWKKVSLFVQCRYTRLIVLHIYYKKKLYLLLNLVIFKKLSYFSRLESLRSCVLILCFLLEEILGFLRDSRESFRRNQSFHKGKMTHLSFIKYTPPMKTEKKKKKHICMIRHYRYAVIYHPCLTKASFFFCYFYKVCIYHCELQLLHFLSACSQILCQSIHEDVPTHTDFLKPPGSSEESHQDLARERIIKAEDIPFSIGIHLCSSSFLKKQPNKKSPTPHTKPQIFCKN